MTTLKNPRDNQPIKTKVKVKKSNFNADIVDEASWESFPCSDPPAWIFHKAKKKENGSQKSSGK